METNKVDYSYGAIENIEGFYISDMSEILDADCDQKYDSDINIIATVKQAISQLAFAQLTQLMKAHNVNNKREVWLLKRNNLNKVAFNIIHRGTVSANDIYFEPEIFDLIYSDNKQLFHDYLGI